MKFSLIGRVATALFAALALGLSMTACGGGTIAFLWVVGDQYNQITGYQVDDYTGNLTQSPGSPFNANGVNPVQVVVKPAGRFLYVVNQGVTGTGSVTTKSTSSGVSLFSVGNQGVLTFQQTYQSQGQIPQWAQFDSSGTYLYVLDKYSNDGSGVGSITVFAADSDTGRLTLVTNSTVKTTQYPAGVPYFNVGYGPTMLKTIGSCLLTLDTTTNSVFPYGVGTSGQLVLTATGETQIQPGSVGQLSSINGTGSSVYFTDYTRNYIYSYTVSSSCALSPSNPSAVANITGTQFPVYSLVDNSGKYLYVLNGNNTPGQSSAYSSISAFTILASSSSQLQAISGAPYTVGSAPFCVVEDPTNQYLYISNQNDGTVTGKIINSTTGELSALTRGSTFPASGVGKCLAISGNVN